VAFTAEIRKEKLLFHLILNAYWEPLDFELPPTGNGDGSPWRRWIDTALESPQDIVEWQRSPSVTGNTYRAEPRSVVVLFAARDRLLYQEP
jgi:glycogen operon protein